LSSTHLRNGLCALLILIGVAVMAGWLFDVAALKSILPRLSTMKFNTALCFALVGFGIAAAASRHRRARQLAVVAGGLAGTIGLLTVIEYASGRQLGIDELLIADTGSLRGSGFPGRMSPLTAISWIALGATITLLALGRERKTIILAHLLVGVTAFAAFLAAAGYAFGAEAFWGIGVYTAIAIHTAVGLFVAVAAVLLTRAEEGWLAPFLDSPDARRLLEGLLPISIVLPFLVGLLLLFGSGLGAYNAAFAFALFVPATTIALVAISVRIARQARDAELALRRSEADQLQSKERLGSALAIAELGTFDWHFARDEIQLDPRSRQIFGFEGREIITVDELLARVHRADLPRLLEAMHGSRTDRSRLEIEYRIRLPDGGERNVVSFSGVAEVGASEHIYGVVGDISARKKLEEDLRTLNDRLEARVRERTAELERVHEQLRQSQKLEAMGQLTGGVAHDFNNLLSPIIGSLDLIQRKGLDTPRAQRLLEGAMASAERAKTLVQRLLAFARRQPLKATSVDVAALLEGMAELIASTSGPRIKLLIDADADLPNARADPNQLEMALLNLAVNARDAMPEGGTITIAAKSKEVVAGANSQLPPGRYISLSVADTGVGMDEKTLARAIEPFFSTKGIGRGTGLGLSMVHGLAAQLGGELVLESKPGLGTIVELLLPLSGEEAMAAERPERTGTAAGTGQALLIDDEEAVRASTAGMLSDIGYVVAEARSAEEALGLLKDGLSPDLVVTDHLMPGMTGTDLARALRESHPTLPVLIISGYAEVDEIAPDLERLAKPFRQSDLIAAIAAIGSVGNGASDGAAG
jgi:signal transduction histidine kinase/CheY-like chemotaxis protein